MVPVLHMCMVPLDMCVPNVHGFFVKFEAKTLAYSFWVVRYDNHVVAYHNQYFHKRLLLLETTTDDYETNHLKLEGYIL